MFVTKFLPVDFESTLYNSVVSNTPKDLIFWIVTHVSARNYKVDIFKKGDVNEGYSGHNHKREFRSC